MKNRQRELVISVADQLCEALDDSLDIFIAERLWIVKQFDKNEQSYFAQIKKTQATNDVEIRTIADELLTILQENYARTTT